MAKGKPSKRARQRRRGQRAAEARLLIARQASRSFPALVLSPSGNPHPAIGETPVRAATPPAAAILALKPTPHTQARLPPVTGRVRLALEPSRPSTARVFVARPTLGRTAVAAGVASLEPPAAVVDIAAIRQKRSAAREAERRRSAAAMLLAPLALLAVMWADPFAGRDPGTSAPSTARRDIAALPPLVVPSLPATSAGHSEEAPASTPPRKTRVPLVAREHDAHAVAVPPALSPHDPASSVILADPPDGFLIGSPRPANPQIGLSKADAGKDVAALTDRSTSVPLPAPAQSEQPVVAALPPTAPLGAAAPPSPMLSAPEARSTADPAAALVGAARQLTSIPGGYDPRYMRIAYPMGDVPEGMGVCSDVIVRSFRSLGIDLQQLVHNARLGTGDANVDHRRVTVLMKFFDRNAKSLPISSYPESYKPGDVVAYDVPWGHSSKWHIAIVTDQLSPSLRPMVIHNRGYGAKLEDALFHKRIIGHYRFDGASVAALQAKMVPTAPPAATAAVATGKTGPRLTARAGAPRS